MLETVEGQPVLQAGPLCKYVKKGLISMDLKLPAGVSNYKWIWTIKTLKKIHLINAGTSLTQANRTSL